MFVRNSYIFISFLLSILLSNIEEQKIIKEQYAILNIPAIQLEEKIFNKNSKYNQLKNGLYLLPESTDLNSEKTNIIIASHSGNAKISYFKNLDQLKINDEIKIIKENEVYLFRVINIYEEPKDGDIIINRYNKKTITLVTCKKETSDLHLVISAIYSGELEKNN